MKSFTAIEKHCQSQSRLTSKLIDEYLIYYAAERSGLEKKMNQQLKRYRQVAKTLPPRVVNIFKSEYLAAQIFRKDGLIGRYLQHRDIKSLPAAQYDFLVQQHQRPWRFSFALILDRPATDFFKMLDVFTEEEYLLYSRGMSETLDEKPVHLWFNLIANNGECWQTYGVIVGFTGFTSEDIFFFATEVNQDIEEESDLIRQVARNPWPFFMLSTSSMIPFTRSEGKLLTFHVAEDELAAFPYASLKTAFTIRWKDEVYELRAEPYARIPHFAKAYYDENEQTWLRIALAEEGFDQLTTRLRQGGVDLDPQPAVTITPNMLLTAENILGRKIELDPYEDLFTDPAEEDDEELRQINYLLELALPYVNNDIPLDLEELAAQAGLDVDLAKEILEKVMAKLRKLRKGK